MPVKKQTKGKTKKAPTPKIQEKELSPLEDAMENPVQQPPRISDNKTELIRDEPLGENLTLRQKRFCQLYATDLRFLGNGAQAYLEVYDVDTSKKGWYSVACTNASRLLSNAKIFNYINELLEHSGLNDAFVDKQLLFLIQQQDDKSVKLGALKEYNQLKQRITKKVEHSGDLFGDLMKKIRTGDEE